MGSTVAPRMGTVAWPKRSSNSDRDAPVGIVDLDNAGLKQANAENQIRRRHGQYRRATYGNSRVAKAQFEFRSGCACWDSRSGQRWPETGQRRESDPATAWAVPSRHVWEQSRGQSAVRIHV